MQPSDFSQCGGGGSEPVRPPTRNAQEAERRATGGSTMARKPRGPPVQTEAVVCGFWGVWHLVLSEGTKNQV